MPTVITKILRMAGIVATVAAVTFVNAQLLRVNSTTAGFIFLVLILALTTKVELYESITASLLSAVVYNFFFLPPSGTLTIADPQNWVALFAFLATAITGSQLSLHARRKADEARARQLELQHLYEFSRGLILGDEEAKLANQIVREVVVSFQVETVWFYDMSTNQMAKVDGIESSLSERAMLNVADKGQAWQQPAQRTLIVPVKLGGTNLGSLGLAGNIKLSEVTLESIVQLVGIAIERRRAQKAAARMDATRQNEQLKSVLLDALAHEFKTPLTSVKVATSTLLSSASLGIDEQRELVSVVDEETDRLTKLVSDSIELARIDAMPSNLRQELRSVEQLITTAIDEVKMYLDGRELKVLLVSPLRTVRVDETLTLLALRQVLNNAIKYSTAASKIIVEAQPYMDSSVLIAVTNVGSVIDRRDQTHIFEKFYRGTNVGSQIPGIGLGLNIAKSIIEAQGGKIWCESELEVGTTFSLTLPADSTDYLEQRPRFAV